MEVIGSRNKKDFKNSALPPKNDYTNKASYGSIRIFG